MKNANPSPEFKRLLRFFLRAARFGLTAGFSLVVAELASWLTSARYARLTYVLVGATMSIVYWWVWGRIFKNMGLRID
jgi:hypothetical protein